MTVCRVEPLIFRRVSHILEGRASMAQPFLSPHSHHPYLPALHLEMAMWGLHQELDLPLLVGLQVSGSPSCMSGAELERLPSLCFLEALAGLTAWKWGEQRIHQAPDLQPPLHIRAPPLCPALSLDHCFKPSCPPLCSTACFPNPWHLAYHGERGGGGGASGVLAL